VTGNGLSKVALAADHVRRVNPWSDIARLETDLADVTAGDLAGIDVALVAVDNDAARLAATRALMSARVPHVDAGVRADLCTARATVCRPAPDGACLLDSWSEQRLARAGEDVGMPCAAVGEIPPYGSSLSMAQAAASVAVHQALALAGVTTAEPAVGNELRLDLAAVRFERFTLPRNPTCAASHALATADRLLLRHEPSQTSLAALLAASGIQPASEIVSAGHEIVTSALCPRCHAASRPYRPRQTMLPCPACGGAIAPLRRARQVAWGDAATTLDGFPASVWFRPGDAFALRDPDGTARVLAFPPTGIAWERGRAYEPARDGERMSRVPATIDLERVRHTRLALFGLGHLGAAMLEALAPLPWAGLLLLDRDHLEAANVQSHALAAAHPGGTTR